MSDQLLTSPEPDLASAPPEGPTRTVGWAQVFFMLFAALMGLAGLAEGFRLLATLKLADYNVRYVAFITIRIVDAAFFCWTVVALWKGWRYGAVFAVLALVGLLPIIGVALLAARHANDSWGVNAALAAVAVDVIWIGFFFRAREIQEYYGPVTMQRVRQLFGRPRPVDQA